MVYNPQFCTSPMQMLGQLINTNEFKEPLKALKTYVKLIENTYSDLQHTKEGLTNLVSGGTVWVNDMVEDMLSYSGMDRDNTCLNTVDVTKLIASVEKDLHKRIKATNACIYYDSFPQIEADGRQVKHLFHNLIENALKYSGDRQPRIHLSYEEVKEGYLFSVKDNGIGLDKQYKEAIFKLFDRGEIKGGYKGTGLGLAVCKEIVENHNGDIWVDSFGKGMGCTFYFLLPAPQTEPLKCMYEVNTNVREYECIAA